MTGQSGTCGIERRDRSGRRRDGRRLDLATQARSHVGRHARTIETGRSRIRCHVGTTPGGRSQCCRNDSIAGSGDRELAGRT